MIRAILFAALFLASVSAASATALDGHGKGPQSPEEVQALFVAAVEAGDIEALKNLYHESAISFPIFAAQRVTGPEGVKGDWGPFLEAFEVKSLELFNTGAVTRGDIGAAWGQFRLVAVPKAGGNEQVTVGRYMDVSQKIGDRWYYIADHASLPTPVE